MQHVILEVLGGPLSGSKAILAPGQELSVGCRTRSDLVIPDERMAGMHFALSWDGKRCLVRRQRNAPETLLQGAAVDSSEVSNGAWIRAGGTDFTVRFEAQTPPPVDFDTYFENAAEDELSPLAARFQRQEREPRRKARAALERRREHALAMLTATDGPRYAVLDAARSPRIRILLAESVERCLSLYDGIDGQAMAHVAPYLVELPQGHEGGNPGPAGSGLLQRLVAEGFEKRWGIFIDYPGSFTALRRHLRRYLMIADADAESRRKYYFRFYDPVVLRAFLPAARPQQRAEFFGEIRGLYAEGADGVEMTRFEPDDPSAIAASASLQLTAAQRTQVGDPAFVDRVLAHFKLFHREDVYWLSDAVLRRRIRHGIAKARGYGLTWEYSLTVFVAHMIRINPEFDKQPAVQRGLHDAALPPDERVDALVTAVSRREWEDAARQVDAARYWQTIDAPPPGAEE